MAHETPRIKATPRERLGTRYATRLRRNGKLPAVVYGHKEEPAHVTVDRDVIVEFVHEGWHMLELEYDGGGTELCLVKDVQYDHLGDQVIHIDLSRTSLSEEVEVTVPLELKGRDDSPGAKAAGAIVEQYLVDLDVRCAANRIPEELLVDVSKMEVGDTITVADLDLPEGVVTDHNPESVVVTIHVVAEEEEEEEPEAAGEEPEVLRERKEEGEGKKGE